MPIELNTDEWWWLDRAAVGGFLWITVSAAAKSARKPWLHLLPMATVTALGVYYLVESQELRLPWTKIVDNSDPAEKVSIIDFIDEKFAADRKKKAEAIAASQQQIDNDMSEIWAKYQQPVDNEVNPWVGLYNATFENAMGRLTVAEVGGKLNVSMSMTSERCQGELDFVAIKNSSRDLLHTFPVDSSGKQCTIKMRRSRRSIAIEETSCFYYHGFECAFNGLAALSGEAGAGSAQP